MSGDVERDFALWQDRPSNAGNYPEVRVSAELYEVLCRLAREHFRAVIAAMQEPASQDEPLSMSRLQMLDHFLARGIALSTGDIEDLRALIRSMPVSYSHPAPEPHPCPTCTGPIRSTVGMVCQTCGTNYAPEPDAEVVVTAEQARLIDGHLLNVSGSIVAALNNAGIKVLP